MNPGAQRDDQGAEENRRVVFVIETKGQATPEDLYMHGKLRVDGDVRTAHKLGFLQNLL